jgi:hypothetical protein
MRILTFVRVFIWLFVAAFLPLANHARGSFIIDYIGGTGSGSGTINYQAPTGEVFTATDPTIRSVGFYVIEHNPGLGDTSVGISLYAGVGTQGQLLASGSFNNLHPGFSGWTDVDFVAINLTVGATYTAIISDNTPEWGVENYAKGPTTDPSTDGIQFRGGQIDPMAEDARFRALTSQDFLDPPPPINLGFTPPPNFPEPATFALFSIGIVSMTGYGLWRRRRK